MPCGPCPHRIYIQSKQDPVNLQHNCMCSTAGAAIVTIVRWLVELRNKVSKDGPVILKERVFFTLSKAKSNRAEQPLDRLHEQLAALLAAHESPFSIKLLDTGVHMEVASADLGVWLRSPAFAPLLHLVQGASARRLTSDQLLHEDNGVQMRCVLQRLPFPNMASLVLASNCWTVSSRIVNQLACL